MTDRLRTRHGESLNAAQSDAAVAAVLMRNRGMTEDEAVAEVLRLKSALTWFDGYIGRMGDDWMLHLSHKSTEQTFCGLYRPRLVTKREANSPKCRWCEYCLDAGQERP